MSGDYTYPGYEEGVGNQTPRAVTPQATIAPTPGQGAQLDEREYLLKNNAWQRLTDKSASLGFIVEPSSRFVAGEVRYSFPSFMLRNVS